MQSFYGSRARDIALREGGAADLEAISDEHQTPHTEHTHTHNKDHIDPSVMVFFTLKDLKVGKRMPIISPRETQQPPLSFGQEKKLIHSLSR